MIRYNDKYIKVFADGANLDFIKNNEYRNLIQGYTFNPSLLRKSGVQDFKSFAKEVLENTDLPVSFEVFSDTLEEMKKEARILSSLGSSIYVKIPVMTTQKVATFELIRLLVSEKIKINITCVFTHKQIQRAIEVLGNNDGIISIFSGRIIDAGYNAQNFIQYAQYNKYPQQQILWASTRGLWNIEEAENAGADIITVGIDLLKKLSLRGKDLEEFSWETVCMFRKDALESGYTL